MTIKPSAGARFRQAIITAEKSQSTLAIVGAVNAYCAMMAEQTGHKALYLSGAGVANASFGMPDLGVTNLNDVLEDAQRITQASELPLLVDIDTGFGGAFSIARSIKSLEKAGVAAVHIEDQVLQKRCGHRPNKAIVSQTEMVDRVKAAVDARLDSDFVIMARTDALAVEGMQSAIDRACACVESGADMIFPEAMITLEQYKTFVDAVKVPVLANITEFGSTPLFTQAELADIGVKMSLYPLSAFRAMNKAALTVYQTLHTQGTQAGVVEQMQTRAELYDFLNYHAYEEKLDALFSQQEP